MKNEVEVAIEFKRFLSTEFPCVEVGNGCNKPAVCLDYEFEYCTRANHPEEEVRRQFASACSNYKRIHGERADNDDVTYYKSTGTIIFSAGGKVVTVDIAKVEWSLRF